MKDKEKQIEEMAKELERYCNSIECRNGDNCSLCTARWLIEQGYQKFPEDNIIYKDGKIYYNGEHIGYINFSFYEDIKALGFGNFEIINKRKGYGTLVIKDIIRKYKDKYDLIYCFVDNESISAINFYKKVGKVCFDIVNDKGQYQVILYGKEDSVVISREEYEEVVKYLKEYEDKLRNFPNEVNALVDMYNKGIKETAEKILERGKYCMPSGLREWIIETFDIEIKE